MAADWKACALMTDPAVFAVGNQYQIIVETSYTAIIAQSGRGKEVNRYLMLFAVQGGEGILVDHVAMMLRRHELKGAVVNVQIKTPDLRSISRQTSLDHHTYYLLIKNFPM